MSSMYIYVIVVGALMSTLVLAAGNNNTVSSTTRSNNNNTTTTTTTTSSFSYAGSELPSDWSLLSITNDRAVINFKNGTSRNALVSELPAQDQTLIGKLKDRSTSLFSRTPLSGAQGRITQWGSSMGSGLRKFGQGLVDTMGTFFN